MEKNQKNILVAVGVLIALAVATIQVNAQNFQGIATYKSDRNMSDFQFQAEGMSPDQMDKIKAQLKKQFQKEYELKFNLTESTWEEAESLDAGRLPRVPEAWNCPSPWVVGCFTKTLLRKRQFSKRSLSVNSGLSMTTWKVVTGK